jgi:hypothetical protein
MHHIVYISSATVPVAEAELRRLLTHCQCNNARNGVTGILLYSESNARFMQVIEGEKTVVQALFATIEQDFRHCGILKLADGPIPQRHFTSWFMGFRVLSAAAFVELAGYIAPHSAAFQQAVDSTHDAFMQKLLKAFASNEVD